MRKSPQPAAMLAERLRNTLQVSASVCTTAATVRVATSPEREPVAIGNGPLRPLVQVADADRGALEEWLALREQWRQTVERVQRELATACPDLPAACMVGVLPATVANERGPGGDHVARIGPLFAASDVAAAVAALDALRVRLQAVSEIPPDPVDLDNLRKIIREHPAERTANAIVKLAGGDRSRMLRALRWLIAEGEFNPARKPRTTTPPAKYRT